MPEAITLIVPVAFDLERDNYKIIPGPGTRLACKQALGLLREASENTYLFFSASNAGPNWDNVIMGRVMQWHCEDLAPELRQLMRFRKAPTFNTLGEIIAVANYIQELQREGKRVLGVVFVVKEWHARRVRLVAQDVFAYKGLEAQVSVDTYPLQVARIIRFLEPLKLLNDLLHISHLPREV